MTHVMLDLETWGTAPGSALRSWGAVVFDPATGALGAEFYRNISDASCEAIGLTRSKDTEEFWARPENAAAQEMLAADQRDLGDVLVEFKAWWGDVKGRYIWGHGASFDPVLAEAAYEACLLEAPWDFWNVRCCRTVLAMANRKILRVSSDTHHNALDDAKAQARTVAAAFKYKQFNPG